MNDKERKIIEDIVHSIPEEFRVIEQNIKESSLKEYYLLSDKLTGFYTDEEIFKEANNWKKLNSEIELKKLLVKLSELRSIESHRKIEEIIQQVKNVKLKEFGHIALKQSRLFLENQLSDESIGFISSGLGGKGNKLRYYFVLKSENQIDKDQERTIQRVIQNISKTRDSELEEIENFGNYVVIKILVSMDEAIGILIEEVIRESDFVDNEYLTTNIEKPEAKFIEKWIKDEL